MNRLTLNPLLSRLALATLLVAGSAAVALPAWAQPMGGPGMTHEGHMGHRGHGAMMQGGGMGMMGMSPRMLDAAKATPEQRTQIQQIMAAAHKDMQAIHEGGRTLRTELMAAFAQPNVDAQAVEAIRQKQLALHDQASKRHLQAALDVSRVLTPDQRKQLADGMNKRRQMMERHMHERRSMDAPKS